MVVMNEIALGDRELFGRFFRQVREPLADTTFTMRYIWAGQMRHTWVVINGNLCVFGFLKDKHVVWGPPIGGGKLAETLAACFDEVERLNSSQGVNVRPSAIYIPDCLKADYQRVAEEQGYRFDFWTQDYIYNTNDLIEMKGPEFDSKRNKMNFFVKNYDYRVEQFEPMRHAEDCVKLVDRWREQKDDVIADDSRYELDAETDVAKKVIRNAQELNVRGVVLRVDGSVVGVSLGESLTPDMCSNIIEKTLPSLKGASQFIFREFARAWQSCSLLNAQDDFGVDYLKQVKLSYHPARLLPSYCLEKK